MLYNPPGGHSYWLYQGAIWQLWSNTVRKFPSNQSFDHAVKDHTWELVKTVKAAWERQKCLHLSGTSAVKYEHASVYLTSRIKRDVVAGNTTSEQWRDEERSPPVTILCPNEPIYHYG